jgi:hypothetical protein
MKVYSVVLLAVASPLCLAQGHDTLNGTGMKEISFLQGDWHGTQNFNTGGAPMALKISNHIHEAVGGRYLTEELATEVPGKKPTDSRHFITFDPKASMYRAWWFNDTSIGPMELEGTLEQGKLIMTSAGTAPGKPVFRATYNLKSPDSLEYTLELKRDQDWQLLFKTSYSK